MKNWKTELDTDIHFEASTEYKRVRCWRRRSWNDWNVQVSKQGRRILNTKLDGGLEGDAAAKIAVNKL